MGQMCSQTFHPKTCRADLNLIGNQEEAGLFLKLDIDEP